MRIACIIPAHNEARVLDAAIRRVRVWADAAFPQDQVTILVSDNASTDGTTETAQRLAASLPNVAHVVSSEAGKGGAIKRAAAFIDADAYLFMDADLSTELASVRPLVDAVRRGTDLAVASRHAQNAVARRSVGRTTLSMTYAALATRILGLPLSDLQCGCKAFSRKLRDELLPRVSDEGYFFDTELAARACRGGWSVRELPVAWMETPFEGRVSKVRVLPQSMRFLKSLARLWFELANRKDVR